MTHQTLNNSEVLRLVTVNQVMVDGFSAVIGERKHHWSKGWPRAAGPCPTAEMFMVALCFGKLRKPGPEAGFMAMQLRPEGASLAELAAAFNSGPAHNHSRDVSHNARGEGPWYFERTKGGGKFWLKFTAKGQKALEKALAGYTVAPATAEGAANDTTKAADKPKSKKASVVAAAEKPTSDGAKPAKARKAKKQVELDGAKKLAAAYEQIEQNADKLAADVAEHERPSDGQVNPATGETLPPDVVKANVGFASPRD